MSLQTLGAWLGIIASLIGVGSSLLFMFASSRTVEDTAARDALDLLDESPAVTPQPAPGAPAPAPRTAKARQDLTAEILKASRANRRDMRWGAILLIVSFLVLLGQSVVMFFDKPAGKPPNSAVTTTRGG